MFSDINVLVLADLNGQIFLVTVMHRPKLDKGD
jgi:hypothetical protein